MDFLKKYYSNTILFKYLFIVVTIFVIYQVGQYNTFSIQENNKSANSIYLARGGDKNKNIPVVNNPNLSNTDYRPTRSNSDIYSLLFVGVSLWYVIKRKSMNQNIFYAAIAIRVIWILFYSDVTSHDDFVLFNLYNMGINKLMSLASFLNPIHKYLVKIPLIATDIGLAFFISKLSGGRGAILCVFYLLSPIMIGSTGSSLYFLTLGYAIYMLSEKNTLVSAIMFSISIILNPAAAFFMPLLIIELIEQRDVTAAGKAIGAFAGISLLMYLLSALGQSFNFAGLLSIIKSPEMIIRHLSASIQTFLGSSLTLNAKSLINVIPFFLYWKSKNSKNAFIVSLLMLVGTGSMDWNVCILAIMAAAYIGDKRLAILAIIFSNVGLFNSLININVLQPILNIFAIPGSLILFVYLLKVTYDITIERKVVT